MRTSLTRRAIRACGEEGVAVAGEAQHGALVTFAGRVRADVINGRAVEGLFYDAYGEMAERQIHHLIELAQARWPGLTARVRHRIGYVPVGGISVAIAVAAPHRGEAFSAASFLLEGIKRHVPIWKREQFADGEAQWHRCADEVEVPHAYA